MNRTDYRWGGKRIFRKEVIPFQKGQGMLSAIRRNVGEGEHVNDVRQGLLFAKVVKNCKWLQDRKAIINESRGSKVIRVDAEEA